MAVFDDGNGPCLYIAGGFEFAGSTLVNNIAKWDGTQWEAIADGTDLGVNAPIGAMAVHDDGTGEALYIASNAMTQAGSTQVSDIAKWDGSAWHPIDPGVETDVHGSVLTMVSHDDGSGPGLFVGGLFPTIDGNDFNNIAKWNGSGWDVVGSAVSPGVSAEVKSMAVFDGGAGQELIIGGHFVFAGGVPVGKIARWDGESLSRLEGSGGYGLLSDTLSSGVASLAVVQDATGSKLVAAGSFYSAGGFDAENIAIWDGVEWAPLFDGVENGLSSAAFVVVPVSSSTTAEFDVFGSFGFAGATYVNGSATWNGSGWDQLVGDAGLGLLPTVYSVEIYDDGNGPALYAAGSFRYTPDGVLVLRVVKREGAKWVPLADQNGQGVGNTAGSQQVFDMAVYDDGTGAALFVAGKFERVGGVVANNIAKWDGSNWSVLTGPMGTGTNFTVSALDVYDDGNGPKLYVGGSFSMAGGIQAKNLAAWDGSEWQAVANADGAELNGLVNDLLVHDDGTGEALYAGGRFTQFGSTTANFIARWDGSNWTSLTGAGGTGLSDEVRCLSRSSGVGGVNALYAAGDFFNAGGVVARRVASWSGNEWSPLESSGGNGVGTSQFDTVLAMSAFDDGDGEKLYLSGLFGSAGGVQLSGLAVWDGSEWSPVEQNGIEGMVGGYALDFASHEEDTGGVLYAAGRFTSVVGLQSQYIARLNGCAVEQCLVDVNGDGSVTAADFTAWINAFNNNLPGCDQNGDGGCTPTDFTAWINNYNNGC